MADVLLLFVTALAVLGGAVAVALTVRAGRRRRELERRERPGRLRAELDQIDQRIRRIDQATADADLDRLDPDQGAV